MHATGGLQSCQRRSSKRGESSSSQFAQANEVALAQSDPSARGPLSPEQAGGWHWFAQERGGRKAWVHCLLPPVRQALSGRTGLFPAATSGEESESTCFQNSRSFLFTAPVSSNILLQVRSRANGPSATTVGAANWMGGSLSLGRNVRLFSRWLPSLGLNCSTRSYFTLNVPRRAGRRGRKSTAAGDLVNWCVWLSVSSERCGTVHGLPSLPPA